MICVYYGLLVYFQKLTTFAWQKSTDTMLKLQIVTFCWIKGFHIMYFMESRLTSNLNFFKIVLKTLYKRLCRINAFWYCSFSHSDSRTLHWVAFKQLVVPERVWCCQHVRVWVWEGRFDGLRLFTLESFFFWVCVKLSLPSTVMSGSEKASHDRQT